MRTIREKSNNISAISITHGHPKQTSSNNVPSLVSFCSFESLFLVVCKIQSSVHVIRLTQDRLIVLQTIVGPSVNDVHTITSKT